ncbi:SDR family oxidoreductase [Fulvivirgaceae bacterium BMA12]|uniref:SDR family oxidoreductase n=1 Tax=Agaribacillus aureus TaxID=3051825 RepID=A0ABT8LAS5_9BACT|nr:SDR family oxidoreductase [Fulvivirgaceae bacterium BMA12]
MEDKKTALITGASKGLGFALAESLAHKGWNLILNARNAKRLLAAKNHIAGFTNVIAISGDVRDEIHLLQLAEVIEKEQWKLDLVVNNASVLGVSPMKNLLDHPVEDLHTVLHTNMIAPISLLQKLRPHLRKGAKIINVSSDAAVEAYETWGAYGGSKAGLDHMTAILRKENPQYQFYAFDPGDMRTDMYQAAFPGEDISDRPLPSEQAVPAIMTLIENTIPGGRYTSNFSKEQAV